MNRLVLCSLLALLCSGVAYGQETCETAIDLACEVQHNFQINTAAAANNYNVGAGNTCTGFASAGPDIVYRIVIPNNGTATFTLTPSTPYDPSIYLVTNCADPVGTCLDGSDTGVVLDPETINYTNISGGDQIGFLILDGFNPSDAGVAQVTGSVDCPQTPPTGACCATDGTCSITTEAACAGTWQGAGTVCDPNPCIGPPTGACCRPGQSCAITTRAECEATGGTYMNDGSTCGPPDPCEIVPVESTTWGRIKNTYGK